MTNMKKCKLKLGVAPTRRNLFSREEAIRQKNLIYERLEQMNVEFVDIEDCTPEGLLIGEETVDNVVQKFRAEEVDGIFFPHVNFGTEDLVCKVASAFCLPILIGGPRDGELTKEGFRLTDSQCGLFATGKVLRRFGIPFNFLTNCHVEEKAFERGIQVFLGVMNVIKEMTDLRILQISTRPDAFWTVMCNEGELLERFGVKLCPVTFTELRNCIVNIEQENGYELHQTIQYIRENMEIKIQDLQLMRVAALKLAMQRLATERKCKAVAIQCWNALQEEIGIMPCAANGLLTDEGIPVVCETDIHGAITSVIAQAASFQPTFFADWTVRHPTNNNAELLQHCGPFPISMAKDKKALVNPFVFADYPGAVMQELKEGEITILRFDGDHGKYSLLAGTAKTVEGPFNAGSYVWIEVENLPKLERKLVEGPYIHHCTGVYGNILAVLHEAERYFDFEVDYFNENAKEKILNWLLEQS